MRNTDRLYKIIQEFMTNDRRHVSKRRAFVRALSIFVVFVMTYMLVLPAFTLDEKSAVEQGGIDVPSAAVQEEEKSEPADAEEKADSSDQSDKTDEEAADKEDSNKEDGDKQDADSSQADADDKKDEPAAASEDEDKDDSEEKDEEEAKEPLSELVFKGDGYTVTVTTKGEKFPADTELKVKEIERKDNTKLYDSYEKSAKEAIKDEDEVSYSPELAFAKFYDITMYSDGSEYEPKSPVEVNITYDKALQKNLKAEKSENVRVIHFANDENDGKVTIGGNKVTPEVIANKDIDVTINKDKMTEATFAAETFSVYAVVYTVDFHWGVNGKQFDFGIPGGGVITLGQIAEAFGIGTDRDAQGTDGAESITVSDDTKEFLENVERVEFSDPELIWTGKADEDTTAGDLIKANGLKPEFSADLTAAQKKAVEDRAIDKGDWALISLKPFITEETLTIVMNNGETFVVKVTDGQIKRTIMTANGETYEITVAYDEDAEIPAGAELKVEEILPDDERYPEYYKQSLEAAGISLPEEGTMAGTLEDAVDSITDAVAEADPDLAEAQEAVQAEREYARVFDIEIQADGQKVEPKADVYTSIKLLDAPSSVETDLKVVHFAGAGTELMDAEVNDGETAGEAELNFTTNEFSVYTVVNANGSTNLNGQTFALVSGIAEDNGEAGWWEKDWQTTDYYTQVVNAHAMTDEELTIKLWDGANGVKGIGSIGVHAWTEGSNSYVGGDVPEYHFESVGNNKYIIYVVKNGTNYYIDQYNNDQETVSLSNNRSWATEFSVDANSDGTVLIHNGNWYLHNTSDSQVSSFDEWRSRNYTMTWNNSTPTGNEYKFKLCKKSDDYDSYAAKKVSVQDVDSTKTVIIYRKIVEEDGTEHLYAVAHDGSLFRIYDGGDSVYWRETDKNLHWVVDTIEGRTYVHSPESEGTPVVYISPFKTTDQIISTNQTSVYLTGKTDGKYGSPIEVWDQEAYDYAGLHVNESGSSVVLQTGTRVSGTSDEFLFAEVSSMPPAEKTRVDTVDSEKLGVHITVFDYGRVGHEYSAGDKLQDMTDIVGSKAYTPHGAQALVTPYLSALNNGVPVSSSAGAMDGLFKDDSVASIDGAATYVKSGVTDLFLASYYNESGMFRYRSEDNYAYLGRDGETSFKVYQQVGSPYPTENVIGHPYYYHGHYMPFNDLDTSQVTSRLVDQYGTSELDLGDGRTYEDVYGVEGVPNYYTGMKIEADFTQPRNGQLENGDDMIFKFTGDDDMWVYIDGVLVLDIGGIHEPLSGTINFRTGKVTNPAGSSLAGTKTLYEIFMATRNNPNTPQEIKDKIDSIQWKDVDGNGTPDTFADYGNHSFGAFYMERGAGASNLDIAFNLKTVLTDQFTVGKEL
ncbi:MAG: fibro-slime domain-containing protein, partial [Clostridiales bacterium]|nr:fibro-slime domain-containing protein [Clostridiales bacterium]